MKKVLAIAGLTWKSAFRYRLFWIMAVLLIAAVVGLPLIAQGRRHGQRAGANLIDLHS